MPWLVLFLSACGGSGAGPAGPTVDGRTIIGQVAKGPLDGATVEIFVADTQGQAVGAALATATTDRGGNWSLTVPGGDQSLVAISTGGRYIDEADPAPDPADRRSVQLGPDDHFAALVPPAAITVAINLYTDALLRKSRFETEAGNFHAVFANNRASLARAFGFDLLTTLPADPIRPDGGVSLASRQYAMALGGIANIVNAYAIANQNTIGDFPVIDAVIDDLTDCRIDGQGVNGPLALTNTVTRDLNVEILRFRNNNLGAYGDTGVLEVDLVECGQSGRVADITAPVFAPAPAAVTVAAVDAQGTPASDPAVLAVLAAVTATDDRDGSVTPQSDIPVLLPLGVTEVRFSASDQAGNVAEIVIVFTVADQDAPTITAPPDLDVGATGPLTPVDLGVPTVADNVTPATQLTVINDAPPQGFPAGIHTVTWRVTDAAGLSAEAVQSVIVRNSPPVVDTPAADQVATEGQAFNASLAAVFVDPDSSLSLSLSGLPAGSGLGFDPVSGVLSGTPNDIDAQASPIAVTLTAMDETTAVGDQFVLTVIDVNNPPTFSVSGDVVRDEDFAAPVIVTVTPDPVRPGDTNDVVYSLDAGTVDFVALAIDPANGALTITSLADANGQGTLRITADDGAAVNNLFAVDVAVTVNPVNDAPVFALSGPVEVVPGFNGTAIVDVVPDAVPADEVTQPVSYSIAHSVAYATITVDPQSGTVSISNVANVADVAAVIAVSADDGQGVNNLHTEHLSFVVRESDKLVFAGEPVDDRTPPISPIFPDPSVVPLSFAATNLPVSLSLDGTTGILSGTPTAADVATGVFDASITIVGSDSTVATFPLVIRVAERDTDFDGLPDRFEAEHATDPFTADTDGDYVGDGIEVEVGADPLTASAKVFRVGSDEELRRLSRSSFAASSAMTPVFIMIEPGIYHEPLHLQAPCDHVTVVGGLQRGDDYPVRERRTLLKAPVSVTGCDAAGLHHLGVITDESALSVGGAGLSLGAVALTSLDGQVMTLSDSSVVMTGSVAALDSSNRTLFELTDASLLRIDDSLFTTPPNPDLFAVSSDSLVQLKRVEAQAPIAPQAGVSVIDPVAVARQSPDTARLNLNAVDGALLTLRFRDHDLPRGYRVELRHGADALPVYDINRGLYMVATEQTLLPAAIMLRVNEVDIPFVIDSTSAP